MFITVFTRTATCPILSHINPVYTPPRFPKTQLFSSPPIQPPSPFCWIWSPEQHLVSGTNHKVSHCAIPPVASYLPSVRTQCIRTVSQMQCTDHNAPNVLMLGRTLAQAANNRRRPEFNSRSLRMRFVIEVAVGQIFIPVLLFSAPMLHHIRILVGPKPPFPFPPKSTTHVFTCISSHFPFLHVIHNHVICNPHR
jgi:hypothetical protein